MKIVTRQRMAMAVVVGALVALALGAGIQAHTKLEKSQPADGATVAAATTVQLWFNEALDVKLSKIDVMGPSGKVDLGPVHAMDPKSVTADVSGKMSDGKYTVEWQTAGDDGHVQKGKFTFTVKGR